VSRHGTRIFRARLNYAAGVHVPGISVEESTVGHFRTLDRAIRMGE